MPSAQSAGEHQVWVRRVLAGVTARTQRLPVADFKSQLRRVCPRLDVVRMQALASPATSLARVVVTMVDRCPPLGVLDASARDGSMGLPTAPHAPAVIRAGTYGFAAVQPGARNIERLPADRAGARLALRLGRPVTLARAVARPVADAMRPHLKGLLALRADTRRASNRLPVTLTALRALTRAELRATFAGFVRPCPELLAAGAADARHGAPARSRDILRLHRRLSLRCQAGAVPAAPGAFVPSIIPTRGVSA